MTTELAELHTACAAADAALAAALEDLRGALAQLGALQVTVSRLQREARDVEFEPVPPAVRAAIDGNLLQRTGFLTARLDDATRKLRECAQGTRDLRAACAQLVAVAPLEPPRATEGPDHD